MSLFELIHKVMHASYEAEMEEQDREYREKKATKEAFNRDKEVTAHTIEQLSRDVNISQDDVRFALKENEDQVMHYPPNPNGNEAHNDLVLYGLRQHREGQPGWVPGVDF